MARPVPIAPTPKKLEDELTTLKKGPGLTVERLRDAGSVIKACHDPDDTEPPTDTIYERVISAMQIVRKTQEGQALWAAFGLDGNHSGDLKDRRRAYGKVTGKMPNTLAGYENKAIKELTLRLLNHYHGAPPLPKDLPIPHGGFYMPFLQVVTHIKDRWFVAHEQTRTVISLVNGAAGFRYGSYDSGSKLDDLVGCTLGSVQVHDSGLIFPLVFDKPLSRGEPHTFSFRETVPGESHDDPIIEDKSGQSFESPTKLYRVVVRFEGDRPKQVWGYHQLHRISRPGMPEEGIPVPIPESGVVSLELTDLHGGLYSGIAWRWE